MALTLWDWGGSCRVQRRRAQGCSHPCFVILEWLLSQGPSRSQDGNCSSSHSIRPHSCPHWQLLTSNWPECIHMPTTVCNRCWGKMQCLAEHIACPVACLTLVDRDTGIKWSALSTLRGWWGSDCWGAAIPYNVSCPWIFLCACPQSFSDSWGIFDKLKFFPPFQDFSFKLIQRYASVCVEYQCSFLNFCKLNHAEIRKFIFNNSVTIIF